MPNSDTRVVQMTNEHSDFYRLIGPFLANRVVTKAYGDKMWDDAGMTWAIALNVAGEVMGFAALSPRGRIPRICNDYVVPEYRDGEQRSVQGWLLDALLRVYPDTPVMVVVAGADEVGWYEKRGFTIRRPKGSFVEMIFGGNV